MLVKTDKHRLFHSTAVTHEAVGHLSPDQFLSLGFPHLMEFAFNSHLKHGLHQSARIRTDSFEGVGYDLDGTLVGTDYNPNGGINLQQESWLFAAGTRCRGKNQELPPALAVQFRNIFEFSPNDPVTGFFHLLDETKLLPPTIRTPLELDHELEPIRHDYLLNAAERGRIAILPGAKERILDMDSAGKLIGLYTSGTRLIAEPIMQRVLGDEICALIPESRRVYGNEVEGMRKPQPEGFSLLAERMGLAPSKLIYIGNSAQDLIGSQAAGYLLSIGVGNAHGRLLARLQKYLPETVVVVSNLLELRFVEFDSSARLRAA